MEGGARRFDGASIRETEIRRETMNTSQAGLILDFAGVLILALRSWSEFRVTGTRTITMGSRLNSLFWRLVFIFGYPLLLGGFVLQFVGSMPKANASLVCSKVNAGLIAVSPNGEKSLCQNGVLWIPVH